MNLTILYASYPMFDPQKWSTTQQNMANMVHLTNLTVTVRICHGDCTAKWSTMAPISRFRCSWGFRQKNGGVPYEKLWLIIFVTMKIVIFLGMGILHSHIYIYIWMIYSYITIVANCCLYWSDYEDLPSTYLSPLTSHNFITYITFPFYRGW